MMRSPCLISASVLLWLLSGCTTIGDRDEKARSIQLDSTDLALPTLAFQWESSFSEDDYLLVRSAYNSKKEVYEVVVRRSAKWKSSEGPLPDPDTTFTIAPSEHRRLYDMVTSLSVNDQMHAEQTGLDGAMWSIQCSREGTNWTVNVWSPEVNTEERHLGSFINAGEAFFKLAGR